MPTPDTRRCYYCGEKKVRRATGRQLSDRSHEHADENGRRWLGRRCPGCASARGRPHDDTYGLKRTAVVAALRQRDYDVAVDAASIVASSRSGEQVVDVVTAWDDGQRVFAQGGGPSPGCGLVAMVMQTVNLVSVDEFNALVGRGQVVLADY